MNLESIKIVLEIITLSAAILGIPIAIFLFYSEKKKERLDREYGTYNALDDKYIDYLIICLDNSDLDIYLSDENEKTHLDDQQIVRQNSIFEILVCLFERAFLMYKGQSEKSRKKQWNGWNKYIEDWMNKESFRNAWVGYLDSQFDAEFIVYMNSVYKKQTKVKIN